MRTNEFGKILYDKKKDRLIVELYFHLKQFINVNDCDDEQCDNEECVVFKAIKEYIKYNKVIWDGVRLYKLV